MVICARKPGPHCRGKVLFVGGERQDYPRYGFGGTCVNNKIYKNPADVPPPSMWAKWKLDGWATALNKDPFTEPHILADVKTYDFPAAEYAQIWFQNVEFCEFLRENIYVLANAIRGLKPGGWLIIQTGMVGLAYVGPALRLIKNYGMVDIRFKPNR